MNLHEILKGKFTIDRKIDFYEHISMVEKEALTWLKGNDKSGIEHSNRLKDNLNSLIPEVFKEKLNPAEIFILLYAVYLHDIGYRDQNNEIRQEHHQLRSKNYILDNSDKYLFHQFERFKANEPPLVAQAVATVCFAHSHESICPLQSIPHKFADKYIEDSTINLRRLAALLRIADETDQAYIRLGTIREHISLPEITPGLIKLHWKGDEKVWEALNEETKKINDTLKSANDYLFAWEFPETIVVLGPMFYSDESLPRKIAKKRSFTPEHYILPKCNEENGNIIGLLHDYIYDWLNDSKRKLLAILGDYGTGKTLFCFNLLSVYKETQHIPIVIELKDIRDLGWRRTIQREMDNFSSYDYDKILLILDGFDELSLTFDKATVLKQIENLSHSTQFYQKVILTSRTQFFNSIEEEKEILVIKLLNEEGPRPLTYPSFERIYISQFDDEQVMKYLTLSLNEEKAKEFWSQNIEKVFDMKDLSRRPILLELIVNNIEAIQNIDGNITPGKLYRVITERWVDREKGRAPQNVLIFMEELAFKMYTKEKYSLHFNTLKDAIDKHFDQETKNKLKLTLDNLDYQIRTCTFLSRDQIGYYSFAHRSFIEYFIAKKLSRELIDNSAKEIPISDVIALFIGEIIDTSVYERVESPEGIELSYDMVYVPPGQFISRNGSDIKITKTEKGFFIDKYPVTNKQFCEFLNTQKPNSMILTNWICDVNTESCRIKKNGDIYYVEEYLELHPVVNVSWHGANAFATYRQCRLPNKAEWKKAAMGIEGRIYPWGNEFNITNCNLSELNISDTTPVTRCSSGSSPYGCMDMVGNVWEWLDGTDQNMPYVTAWQLENEVCLLGGSFTSDKTTACGDLWLYPNSKRNIVGFRCIYDRCFE